MVKFIVIFDFYSIVTKQTKTLLNQKAYFKMLVATKVNDRVNIVILSNFNLNCHKLKQNLFQIIKKKYFKIVFVCLRDFTHHFQLFL